MQSASNPVCEEGNSKAGTAWLLNQHELDQEYLYRLWKAGRINEDYVQVWAKALTELQSESPCDYFTWLMKHQPMLV